MSFELVHTSVQKGLRGRSGFEVVVVTRGLPTGLESSLEELSAYDHDSVRAIGADKVEWAHRILTMQGRSHSVLSKTTPFGMDWSGRPNRLAHHVVVEQNERAVAGPAWALANQEALADAVPDCEERASGPRMSIGRDAPRVPHAWIAAGFDPGWAGVVAKLLLDAPHTPCYLVLPSGSEVLPLLQDIFALIPEDRRWHLTFSTRYLRTPASTKCALRCVRSDATELRKYLAEPGVGQVRVEPGLSAGDSPSAASARQGHTIEVSARVVVTPSALGSQPASPTVAPTRVVVQSITEVPEARARREDDAELVPDSFGIIELEPPKHQPIVQSRRPTVARTVAPPTAARDLGSLPAYVLFGIAGAALLASCVLAVLLLFKN